jgi:DNA-binding NarL/FixJ family response regulator
LKTLLTSRERAILELVANGKTSGEVADILRTTKAAVEEDVKNAARKLRAANRIHEDSKRTGNKDSSDNS